MTATSLSTATPDRQERKPYTLADRGLWLAGLIAAVALAVTVAAFVGNGDYTAALIVAGAVAGVALFAALGTDARLIALIVVAALTVFGEFRSISATIDRLAPLRALDRIGRLSPRP